MIKIKGIETLDILTPDVPRMANFYNGTLGIPFYIPWNGEKDLCSLDIGGLVVCLMHTNNKTPPPHHSMQFDTDPSGFDSIALAVDNIHEAFAALDGKVDWVRREPVELRYPNGAYHINFAFHDPDGNMIYIQESKFVRPW